MHMGTSLCPSLIISKPTTWIGNQWRMAQVLGSCTYVGNTEEIPGFSLGIGSALVIAANCGDKQQMKQNVEKKKTHECLQMIP